MSNRNGKRAKINREHRKLVRRQKRGRELQKIFGNKTPAQEVSTSTEDGNQFVSSRLRQLNGDSNADLNQGGRSFEIVVYKRSSEGNK